LTNQYNSSNFARERRGVGAIIGGVILAAILLTTVMVYFITILNNEKAKTSYEILASQATQDKAAEKFTVPRAHDLSDFGGDFHINIQISNNGSLPLVVSKILLYCTSVVGCPTLDPVENAANPSAPVTLNAADVEPILVGPVADALTYRIDVISERGNIVAAKECQVDLTGQICSNDLTGPAGPDFGLSATPSSLVFEAGESRSTTITVTSFGGFNSAVSLSVPTVVTGITTDPVPNQVTPPPDGTVTSTLTFASAPTTVPGTYIYTIEGVSGVTHSTQVTITILGSIQGEVDKGIIQGTGSIKLDFKAFGAIYPELAQRAGVDQRGWDVRVSSGFSWVPGYPAYDVMRGQTNPQIVFIESARNMDPSGQNMVLNRNTGLVTSNDQVQGTPPSSSYICKGDVAAKTLLKYNEGANSVTLPNTPVGSPETAGWQQMFFCSTKPSDGGAGAVPSGDFWTPGTKFSQLNGIFWIARASFTPIFSEYAQTIPYQGVTYAKSGINACLRNVDVNTACLSPTTSDNAASLRYSATSGQMAGGVSVWTHIQGSGLTSPYNISWLYPDGTYRQIALNQALNAQGNIRIDLPSQNSNDLDGNTLNDIDTYCTGVPAGQGVYFTLIVTDSFDSGANRNVYDITWRMTC
jgi:hypothetical protein